MQLVRGSTYFTSNFGLVYTVDKIWQNSKTGNPLTYAAVSYSSTQLTNCEVPQIVMQMERRDNGVNAANDWWTWSESYAYTTAICNVIADKDTFYVNLTVQLAPNMRLGLNYNNVPSILLQRVDTTNQASLWWGAQTSIQWYQGLNTFLAYGDNALPDGNDWPPADSATISKKSPPFQAMNTCTDITSGHQEPKCHRSSIIGFLARPSRILHGRWQYQLPG